MSDQLTLEDLGVRTVDIAPGSSATVQVPWHVAAPDNHRIRVSVSPNAAAAEISLANNSAGRSVVLGYPVGVGGLRQVSDQVAFASPRPNPSRGLVTLAFQLQRDDVAVLEVFDVMGRRVRRWDLPRLLAGPHTVDWDGRFSDGHRVVPGIFLCRLRAGSEMRTQKLIFR